MAITEETRLLTKVASLYYQYNLRQTEIAQRLDLSQASVSRLLKRALEEGIVRISISVPRGSHTELEYAIEQRYGLKEVIIVDSDPNYEQLLRNLGAATAYYLETTIRDGELIGISSWSETLLAATVAMHPLNRSVQAHVVQILGGVGNPNAAMHAAKLTHQLAQLVNGDAAILNVPGVVSSRATRDVLLSEPNVEETTRLFEKITLALVGIGSIEPSRVLASSGNVFSNTELESLHQRGAVGDVCLRFFDKEGQQINSDLNDRVIGISLDQLKRMSRTVGIAGGETKYQAIRGAARGGLIHVLITDAEAAQWLLEHPG